MKRHNCRGTGCGWCEDEARDERRAELIRDVVDGLAALLALGALIGACLLAGR